VNCKGETEFVEKERLRNYQGKGGGGRKKIVSRRGRENPVQLAVRSGNNALVSVKKTGGGEGTKCQKGGTSQKRRRPGRKGKLGQSAKGKGKKRT